MKTIFAFRLTHLGDDMELNLLNVLQFQKDYGDQIKTITYKVNKEKNCFEIIYEY